MTRPKRCIVQPTSDAQYKAKEKGADVLNQWDAALDGATRPNHRKLDGQIRELDEPFEVAGMKAMFPGDFGKASEDCNCRCAILQRARWALDESELNELKERAAYYGLDKTKDFEDFQKKYLKASEQVRDSGQKKNDEDTSHKKASEKAETLENTGKNGIIKVGNGMPLDLQLFAEADIKNQSSNSLKRAMRKYESKISEHEAKIKNPAAYVPDWETKDVREQTGLIRHWQKEIRNFEQSINDRIDELKERGDYDE